MVLRNVNISVGFRHVSDRLFSFLNPDFKYTGAPLVAGVEGSSDRGCICRGSYGVELSSKDYGACHDPKHFMLKICLNIG